MYPTQGNIAKELPLPDPWLAFYSVCPQDEPSLNTLISLLGVMQGQPGGQRILNSFWVRVRMRTRTRTRTQMGFGGMFA